MREAAARALAVDRSGFQPLLAVRAAAGLAVPVAIGSAAGHLADGVIAAAGALPAGVAGLGAGGHGSRARIMLATAAGMAVSTFVGSLVADHLAAKLAFVAAWGFAAGLVVVLGREATIVGTQALIGLVVFGRFPGALPTAALHAAWVFAGGGLQAMLAATFRPPQRYAAERRALADAYAELAALAAAPGRSGLRSASTAAEATGLVSRRPTGDDADLMRGLADEAQRIRLEIQSLATVADVAGVADVTAAAAGWLATAAGALRAGGQPPQAGAALPEAVERLRRQRDAAPAGRAGTHQRYAAARASALLGQLRAVDRLAAALAGTRRFVLPRRIGAPAAVLALPDRAADVLHSLARVATDPQAPAFRHAVRLAVILPLTEGVGQLLPGQRGYWVTLTAAVVLKPDFGSTTHRGLARLGGTGLGVVGFGLFVAAVHPSGAMLVPLIAVVGWASYASFAASYALYSVAITGLVVLLLAPIGGHELSTVADRGADTLVGGAIAMLAYTVWPTWEAPTLEASLRRLLDALATYSGLLLSGYVDPEALDRQRLEAAATEARRARMTAQASLDRARTEPARAGADTEAASGILAAARRIVIELHALRTTLEDADELAAVPEVAAIRDSVTAALRALADGRPATVQGLREQQQALEDDDSGDPASLRARRRALVAAHLDPLVDSVDTVAHVMSRH